MRTFKEATRGSFLYLVLVLLFFFSLAYSATPQTLTTGQVLGRLTDPSGAFVPQAKIELRDTATGSVRVTTTDEVGEYIFSQVTPGIYSVAAMAAGFAKAVVSPVAVEVGKSTTINIDLKLGKATEVVEVRSTPGADLQTLDSTVGNTVRSDELLALPTIERSTTSLLLLQPLAMPQQSTSTSQASRFGGQVAGARSDQNSFLLDGGEITNPTSGNTDYWKAFSGSPEGSIPTPVESIQEFHVETNNPSGPLSLGGGAHVVLVTKRGADTYHGSLYEYYRGAVLNANRWDANRIGRERPNIVDNRFGASFGGHVLPDIWKSYFYVHYEGRRRSDAAFITRLVPTSTMRQGILRFKDNTGTTVSYFLQPNNVSSLCGQDPVTKAPLNLPCDPRTNSSGQRLGMASAISQLWGLMPPGNDTTQGDGLNTIGFSGFARFPLNTNLGIIRFDHTFNPKLQWTVSYRHYTEDAGIARQVDIGGIVGNDVRGVPKILSTIPRQPRYLVTGVTSDFTQYLTNDVHLSWLRDYWQWIDLPPFAQLPSITPAALVPGGDSVNTQLVPVNIDTQGARTRLWNSHGLDLRDDASWIVGKHLLRFGGSFKHTWAYFQRDDGQQNNQKTLQYFLGTVSNLGGLTIPASSQPPTCPAAVTPTPNCLPFSQTANWNNLYAQVLGLVDGASILRARDAGLNLLPEGTDLKETVRYNQTTLYAQDSWRLGSAFTLTYGLAWEASIPPVEDSGKFMMTVDSSGNLIFPRAYLEQRRQAALAGQVFNPPVGFVPIGKTGRKYPFDFVKDNFSPRVSAAWQPNFASGILGTLFGKGKSVLRGGYWHFYDRLNGVQTAIDPLQAVGFGQALLCQGPGLNAATAPTGDCRGSSGVNPSTAFRIGIDGSTISLPGLTSTLSTPVIPGTTGSVPPAGANIPFVPNSFLQDPQWRPGSHNQWDFTIQREVPGNGRIEVGYVGHTAKDIYMGIDLNQVPFFMTAGGQTFAQAFDAVAQALKAGSAVTPQAFFETALAGSAKFCGGSFTSCTAGVVNRFSSSAFTNQQARNVFNGIQSAFKLRPATQAATQFTNFFYWSSLARSNYNAAFVSYRVRAYHGLTLDANLSYGHSLDNTGVNQDTDRAFTNSYNPDYDYGTSVFDRKFVFTVLGVWQVPLHSQTGWVNRVVGGWQVAPIVGIYSGLPLRVLDGSGQEFGQTSLGEVSEAIRISSGNSGAGRHNVTTTSGCGSSANPATGGTGLNIFADPGSVCGLFRPVQLSTDTTSRGGTLRGLGAWNIDVSFEKKIQLTEKTRLTFSSEFFNLFNHVTFLDPAVSLQSPQTFGVLTTQANDPRQVQLGLRFEF